jgi:hypothetical protein
MLASYVQLSCLLLYFYGIVSVLSIDKVLVRMMAEGQKMIVEAITGVIGRILIFVWYCAK